MDELTNPETAHAVATARVRALPRVTVSGCLSVLFATAFVYFVWVWISFVGRPETEVFGLVLANTRFNCAILTVCIIFSWTLSIHFFRIANLWLRWRAEVTKALETQPHPFEVFIDDKRSKLKLQLRDPSCPNRKFGAAEVVSKGDLDEVARGQWLNAEVFKGACFNQPIAVRLETSEMQKAVVLLKPTREQSYFALRYRG